MFFSGFIGKLSKESILLGGRSTGRWNPFPMGKTNDWEWGRVTMTEVN